MIDPSMKPLCDQRHGEMNRAHIHGFGGVEGLVECFQCGDRLCGRVYSEGLGYREWVQGRGGGTARPSAPRCKAHPEHWMYVREYLLDGKLLYACPENSCTHTVTEEVKGRSRGVS